MTGNDYASVFPRWMQELKRFLTLKSQFYLYGNIYDCFYFPANMRETQEIDQLKFAKYSTISHLLRDWLEVEGFELICTYDILDGLDVMGNNIQVTRENLFSELVREDKRAVEYFGLRNDSDYAKFDDLSRLEVSDYLALFRCIARNRKWLSAIIVENASRFISDPGALDKDQRRDFLKVLKSAQESAKFPTRHGRRNIIIFICNKLNDLPPWLMIENPLSKGIEIQKPNKEERHRFYATQSKLFYGATTDAKAQQLANSFGDLTDGFTNTELEHLIAISNEEQITVNASNEDCLNTLVDRYKYGTKESFWEKLDNKRLADAEVLLRKRVLGQEEAIHKAVDIIRRAKLGLNSIDQSRPRNRPKGVLFFAGPTGTGKTELAKSLAELIFGDEDSMIRFDMSEYNDSNSDVKLIGSPPGYVGYEEGGQLTRQIRSKPFSVVLFDEIEKAHRVVFDKFLQILDDGRLTDGKGETAYFSECLIIFTSNLGVFREDEHGNRLPNIVYSESTENYADIREAIMREITVFFTKRLNRPEILNRFGDNFVVFDFIRPPIDEQILRKSLANMQANLAKQKGHRFECDDDFVKAFIAKHVATPSARLMGGRGINNKVEAFIKNGIARFLFQQEKSGPIAFRAVMGKASDGEVVFECIGD